MVTHDPAAAAIAERVLFLVDGRVVKELRQSTSQEILGALDELTAA